jgi:hypothetical protein
MRFQAPLVGIVVASLIALSACGGGDSGLDAETASGFIFIDSAGSHICESMMESYPPQCGEPSMKLLDLDPQSVVALMSPEDPTLATVSWTDYTTGVEGFPDTDGLSSVVLTDPVYTSGSSGLVLRTADLGIVVGEPAVWPFDLTNGTDTDMALTFTDAQRIEVTLGTDAGEVYRWSDDMMFAQIIGEEQLPAGATIPYVLTAEPIDIPPGEYVATAWATALEATDVVVTWQVTVSG